MLAHNVTQVGAGASMFALKLGDFGKKAAEKIEQTARSAAEKLRTIGDRLPFPDEPPSLPVPPKLTLPPPDAPSQGPLLLLAAVVVLVLVLR